MIEIVVNGDKLNVVKEFLSYDDVALLAGEPHPIRQDLTITWTTPPKDNQGLSGTLRPGRSIDIEPKMVFDVVRTNLA